MSGTRCFNNKPVLSERRMSWLVQRGLRSSVLALLHYKFFHIDLHSFVPFEIQWMPCKYVRILIASSYSNRNDNSYENFIAPFHRFPVTRFHTFAPKVFSSHNWIYDLLSSSRKLSCNSFFVHKYFISTCTRKGKSPNVFLLMWASKRCFFREKERFLCKITMGNLFNGTYGVSQQKCYLCRV